MTSYKRIGAVKTTIDIIQYLARQKEPVSVKSLSEELNMSSATALCYLATLEDDGFARSSRGNWGPGIGMVLIRRKMKKQLEIKSAEINGQLGLIEEQEKIEALIGGNQHDE